MTKRNTWWGFMQDYHQINRHSRGLLSGIPNLAKKQGGDPRQRPSVMTSNWLTARKGFTFIELLVVMLIIGILAAIALPQYNKAVEKSKATQAVSLLKSVVQAEQSFYLSNGYYTNNFLELDIVLPWDGNKTWANNWISKASNDEWSLQSNVLTSVASVTVEAVAVGRLTGQYQGGGFIYILENNRGGSQDIPKPGLYCAERMSSGIVLKDPGSYCQRLFNLTYTTSILSSRLYRM